VTGGTGAGAPVIGAVLNAASFQPVPLVAGSLATITGSNLGGQNVSVTFNTVPAPLLYTGASQINLQVPAEMALKTTAQMIVTVDGQSAAQTVGLALVSPAIFNSGILNQDNSVNSVSHPADLGSAIQIFATGLLSPGSGTITARIVGSRHLHAELVRTRARNPRIAAGQFDHPRGSAARPTSCKCVCGGADPNSSVCSPQATVFCSSAAWRHSSRGWRSHFLGHCSSGPAEISRIFLSILSANK
jgi:hypothetical protein